MKGLTNEHAIIRLEIALDVVGTNLLVALREGRDRDVAKLAANAVSLVLGLAELRDRKGGN